MPRAPPTLDEEGRDEHERWKGRLARYRRKIEREHEAEMTIVVAPDDLDVWLDDHDYSGVSQMRGATSQQHVQNPAAFARANYAHLVTSFTSPYDWRMAETEGELRS